MLYKFSGIAAHAAGDPYNGRSALDAVELMNIGVQFLREHMTDDCRIHYAITDAGGVSPNVVQAHASVLYMVRANRVADSVKLQARVDKIAEGAAMMTDTKFERVFIDGTAELLPNYTIEKALYEFLRDWRAGVRRGEHGACQGPAGDLSKKYGRPGHRREGGREHRQAGKASHGEHDKAHKRFYHAPLFRHGVHPRQHRCGRCELADPTSQIEVAAWPADVPNHSWQVVSFGKSGMAKTAMLTAGKVLAATAIDLIEKPELLSAAKAEFEEKSASGYVCPIEDGAVPIAL